MFEQEKDLEPKLVGLNSEILSMMQGEEEEGELEEEETQMKQWKEIICTQTYSGTKCLNIQFLTFKNSGQN